jgi:hypothetical protein
MNDCASVWPLAPSRHREEQSDGAIQGVKGRRLVASGSRRFARDDGGGIHAGETRFTTPLEIRGAPA